MLAKRFPILAVAAASLACSSGTTSDGAGAGSGGDHALVVPEDLTVVALAGGNGVLNMVALTLHQGPSGIEVYAALRNEGEVLACSAGLSLELLDKAEQSVAAGISGLLTKQLYRLTDGSDAIVACAGPGDVTMAAVTDFPPDIVIDDLGTIVYRCPYFELPGVAISGLTIRDVKSVARDAGTAYTGTLVNELDRAVSNTSVTVFPVNRVGRPLGVAIGSDTIEIPPGGSWAFSTSTADAVGVAEVAYPGATLVP